MRRRRVRIEANCFVVVGEGEAHVTLNCVSTPVVGVDFCDERSEPDSLVELRDGGVVASGVHQLVTAGVVSYGIAWHKPVNGGSQVVHEVVVHFINSELHMRFH